MPDILEETKSLAERYACRPSKKRQVALKISPG